MKHLPKIALGIIILAFAAVLVLIGLLLILKKSQKQSFLTLDLVQNNFKINFSIAKEDKFNFEKFFENLGIKQNLAQGVNFTLDASTSARLAFQTPAKAALSIKEKELDFSAVFNKSFQLENQKIDQINIPEATTMAIFAPGLSQFVLDRLHLPQNAQKVFENNLTTGGGQYLLVNQDGTFALLYKKTDLNLDNFTQIPLEATGDAQPQQEQTQYVYSYKQVQSFNTPDQTPVDLVFSTLGGYQVLASNEKTVQDLVSAQNSGRPFPKSNNKPAAIAIEFENPNDVKLPEDFFKFLFAGGISNALNQQKLQDSMQKMGALNLLLYDNVISGLINLK